MYIDNRLIGAVAYGWSFAKEAIAGVTPINEMKSTLLNIPTEEKGISLTSADWELPSFPQNEHEPGSQSDSLVITRINDREFKQYEAYSDSRPLVVSGVNGEVLQGMQPFLILTDCTLYKGEAMFL